MKYNVGTRHYGPTLFLNGCHLFKYDQHNLLLYITVNDYKVFTYAYINLYLKLYATETLMTLNVK